MSALTNVQFIEQNGKPAFAVIPYDEYLKFLPSEDVTIPHEVVGLVVKKGMSLVKAWRTHLGMTQAELAEKLLLARQLFRRWKKARIN